MANGWWNGVCQCKSRRLHLTGRVRCSTSKPRLRSRWPTDQSLKTLAQPAVASGGSCRQTGADEISECVALVEQPQMLFQIDVRRDVDPFPCLPLNEGDPVLLQVHVLPFHPGTITEPRASVVAEKNDRHPLAIPLVSSGQKISNLLVGEQLALDGFARRQLSRIDWVVQDDAVAESTVKSRPQSLDVHNHRLGCSTFFQAVGHEAVDVLRRNGGDLGLGELTEVVDEQADGVAVALNGASGGILRLLGRQPVVEKILDRGNLDGIAHDPLRQIRRELLDLDDGHLPCPPLRLCLLPRLGYFAGELGVLLLGGTLDLPAQRIGVAGGPVGRVRMFPKAGHDRFAF